MCMALAKINEAICVITETTAQAVFEFSEKSTGGKAAKAGAIDDYLFVSP